MCMLLAYPRDNTLGNPGEYLWELNKLGSLPLGSVKFRTIFQLKGKRVGKIYIKWNLDLTNLYVTNSSVCYNERFFLPL